MSAGQWRTPGHRRHILTEGVWQMNVQREIVSVALSLGAETERRRWGPAANDGLEVAV